MPAFYNLTALHEARRTNLRRLMDSWGGPTAMALRLGHSNGSFISQLAGPHPTRNISEKQARLIEQRLNLEPGWLDRDVATVTPLDNDVLARSITAVTLAQSAMGVRLPPAKFAESIAIVYDHVLSTGSCSEQYATALIAAMLG